MALIEGSASRARRRGEGLALACIDWATAVLYNGLGRYEKALAAAKHASEHPQELWSTFILPELIEAAVRSGQAARAAGALDLLAETTRAASTDWALGTEARSRALLTRDEAAEDLYREAVDRLGRSGLRVEQARVRLLYGEWPRRQRRRRDARDQLRAAYRIFVSAGAGAFAERARTELLATGERAPKRAAQTRETLTGREAHIARLAGQGASNPEIAAQLFISPATVAYHLRKVFTTLGISSRSEPPRCPHSQTGPARACCRTKALTPAPCHRHRSPGVRGSSPAPGTHADPADMSVRFQVGRSCHKRRSTRAREITGSRRRGQPNTGPTIRTCQQPRRCARMPGPYPRPLRSRPRTLTLGPRGTTDCHDQHKLTQPHRAPKPSGTVPGRQKLQVTGHITGSRDRTRTYNLPVNRRSVMPGDRGCLRCCQPV